MKMSLKIGNTNERGEINIKHARKWRIMYTDMYRERERERCGAPMPRYIANKQKARDRWQIIGKT